MAQLKGFVERLILAIILVSIVLTFVSAPSAQAKLSLGENEFYYPGTTDGTYVEKKSLGEWLVEKLAEICDYILGVVTMGGRMVFVGWTALLEHILTWVLETASGINLDGEDISATDLTALNDSSKNVTVQAIVYNRVPALNVNFFKIKTEDLFKVESDEGTKFVSPTGIELKCKKCGKPVVECCTGIPADRASINIKDNYCNTECKCNGKCSACQTYKAILHSDSDKKPAIVQIKILVATWYRYITLFAYAVMLVLLIFLGIKLAISNLSSDKALYKKMLADWLVGMVIIASIQMMMYFAIMINEMSVKIVADAADKVNEVQIKHMTETDPDKLAEYESSGIIKLSDQEIEIDVYEAIRTRAYDAKLTVGMSGMVMYMALVYYAFRYTLMYARRLLNLAILTIMGPGVGVSYAYQKIMHGKGMSFKNWLREYILTLFIQVIHAILYAVFISQALVFSLHSVAGMIFALIMIHYAFTMDKLFRKVFNFGEGGAMRDMDSAGDLAQKRKDLKAMKNFAIGGTATAKLVMNSPYSNAVKAVGKAAGSAAVLGASAIASGVRGRGAPDIEEDDNDYDESGLDSGFGGSLDGGIPDVDDAGIPIDGESSGDFSRSNANQNSSPVGKRLNEKRKEAQEKEDKELLELGRDKLRANVRSAAADLEKNPTFENRQKYEEAQRRLARYDELNQENRKKYSTTNVIAGKLNQVFNISTYIQYSKGKDGRVVYKFRNGDAATRPGARGLSQAFLGSSYYDPYTGKIIKNKDSAIDQLRLTRLLNMTKEDQQVLKDNILKPISQGLGGMAAMYLGMFTLVENPKLGMSMLAAGYVSRNRAFKMLGVRRKDRKYKKRYKFNSFNVAATENICNTAIKLAEKDRDRMMIEQIRRNHYKLYITMRNELEKAREKGANIERSGNFVEGLYYKADDLDDLKDNYNISVGTLHALENGGTVFVPAEALSDNYAEVGTEYMDAQDGYDYYANPEFMNAAEKAEHDFMRDSFEADKRTGKSFGKSVKSVFKAAEKVGRFDKTGEGVNNLFKHHYQQFKQQEKQAEKDKMELTKNASRAAVSFTMKKLFDATEESRLEELGFEKANGKIREIENQSNMFKDEIKDLPTANMENVDRMIDLIIKRMSNGKELDLDSEKTIDEIIKRLGIELFASNLIGRDDGAEVLFKNGYAGLKRLIKRRGTKYNATLQSVESDLSAYSKESQELIMDAIQEAIDERTDSKAKYENMDPKEVLEKMKEQAGITENPTRSTSDGSDDSRADNQSEGKSRGKKSKETSVEDVEKYIVCKAIIEVTEQEISKGSKKTYSSKEIEAAKEYIERMDPNQRDSMQQAIDSISSEPITEQEVMKKLEEKIQSGNPFTAVYSGPLIDIKKLLLISGSDEGFSKKKDASPDQSFFKKTLKKVLGKVNGSLNKTLSTSEVQNIVESEQEKDNKKMLSMLEMVYLGDGEEAKRQVLESSDNDDIKRKKLETLLTFESQMEKMEDINEYAMANSDRLGMKNAGSKEHKALKMDVKEEDLELARKKLELAKYEKEHGRIDDVDYQKLSSTEKLDYNRMRAVKDEIVKADVRLREKKEGLKKNGPVTDIKKDLLDMVGIETKKKKK